MYKHAISRYEKNLDHDSNVVSIFLAVNVSNTEGSTTQEHWLTEDEKNLVLQDEANLAPIIEKVCAQGELKLENEIATRPMPTIYVLEEEGKKEALETLVKHEEIAVKKEAIVAEAVRVKAEKLQEVPLEEPIELP